jgi:hypothetical protein
MAKQIVIDATGDTRHEFDAADATSVAEAERRFKALTGAGFTAAVRRGQGRSELIRSFDPAAEETVIFSTAARRLKPWISNSCWEGC